MRKNNKYTDEFKERIVKKYLKGDRSSVIEREYGVSRKIVYRWVKKWREHSSFPDNRGKGSTGRPRTIKREDMTDNEYIAYLEMQLEIKKFMAFYEKRKQK